MEQDSKYAIIAGSTKCGTTSLFEYLSTHPQICASVIKETRFFWSDEYVLPKPKLNDQDGKNYDDFFQGCSSDQWKLEATPDYIYSASTAAKIKSGLSQCKIIFILRDPSERIISWFKYGKQRGMLENAITLDAYLKILMDTDPSKSPQHLRALEQGQYAKYLQPYFALFGKENILVTFHKNLESDPKKFMFAVCDFLGVEKSFYNNYEFRIYNPSLNVKSASGLKKYTGLKKKLRSYNNKLPTSLRFFFKRLLQPLDVFYLKTKSSKWEKIVLSSFYKKEVSGYYRRDHELLEKILEKKITW